MINTPQPNPHPAWIRNIMIGRLVVTTTLSRAAGSEARNASQIATLVYVSLPLLSLWVR